MTFINNPHDLIPSQADAKATKAQPINPKGEFDCNFTLYIALTKEAKANPKNYRYSKEHGKKVPVNGITFYSKFLGKLEPTPEKVLQNFMRIVRDWSAGDDMAYAVIYWNVNRGKRVEYHFKKMGLQREIHPNTELMRFDKRGKTTNSAAKMFSVPLFHTEDASAEKINAYYHTIRDFMTEGQASAVHEYLCYYYNPEEKSKKLYPVEISTEPPKPKTYEDILYEQHFENEQELINFCKKEKEGNEGNYQLLLDFYRVYKDTYLSHSANNPKVQSEPSTPTPISEQITYLQQSVDKTIQFGESTLPTHTTESEFVSYYAQVMGETEAWVLAQQHKHPEQYQNLLRNFIAGKQKGGQAR